MLLQAKLDTSLNHASKLVPGVAYFCCKNEKTRGQGSGVDDEHINGGILSCLPCFVLTLHRILGLFIQSYFSIVSTSSIGFIRQHGKHGTYSE